MAQKYYNTQETARILNVSVDDVKKMLDRRELYGYRDGADWKFKTEDIDRMAKEQSEKAASPEEAQGGDVLLSDVALGQSEVGTSGTVIAMDRPGPGSGQSDIRLAGSSVDIVQADTSQTPVTRKKDEVDSKVSRFEELDLALEEDLTLEDSAATLAGKSPPGGSSSGGSAIDLSGKGLEDDDLVLGGSGKGSDVTIGSDSGISLVDPADSGLSLEQPLDLTGTSGESLELGEDDMLAVGEAGAGSAPTVKTDDDFLLTPLEETTDTEGSESGSQVIALDTEGDEASTMLGAAAGPSMAAMLDEDLTSQPLDMGMGAPMAGAPVLGAQPGGLSEGAPSMQPTLTMPEAPYSGWLIAGLAACVVSLMLCGMMMYDNMRNMWSWEGPYSINSSLMDLIVGLFERK
jgi:excisionase family DNA binding protein